MSRKHFQRFRRELEPQDKPREIIQCHLLPVELLLHQEFPVEPEHHGIGTKCMTSRANSIQVLQITRDGFHKSPFIIDNHISLLLLQSQNLYYTHPSSLSYPVKWSSFYQYTLSTKSCLSRWLVNDVSLEHICGASFTF